MASIQQVDNLEELNEHDFANFMQTGLVYVKLPAEIKAAILYIREQTLEFFHLPGEIKDQYPMQDGDGYLDQAKKTIAQIERYIYRRQIIPPSLKHCEPVFSSVRNYLAETLFAPTLEKIFSSLALQEHFAKFSHEMDQTLSLIYYPALEQSDERLQAHKDLAAMTALWAPEAGLNIKIDGKWQQAFCSEDYIALQLGRSLQLATNSQCQALEHQVCLTPNKERFSIASFYVPNNNLAFKNYVTDETICDDFSEFIKQELQAVYPAN